MITVSAWQQVISGAAIPELRLGAWVPGCLGAWVPVGAGLDKTGNYKYYEGSHYDKHHI